MGLSVGPLSAPEPSPTPIVTATPETAATPTPSPTPSPTPEPDKPLTMEASVIQQDVGVTLYVENAPEPSLTPDASASPSPTPSKSAKEDDAENEKTPLLGVAATITLTDAKGNATDYELDTETGTALAEDVTPTLAVQPIEGYTQPEAQTVTVKEKVVYKADVKAVKEKIVQASQVNESAEDSGVSNAGSAPIVNEVTDTVTYADSAKTETGSRTCYTAKLSSSGHLLLADGTETPYLPVYQDGTKDLIGAMRDTSYAANTATAAWLPGAADSVTLLGAANTRMAWVHRADEPVTVQEDTGGTAPAAEETPVPADPTPEPAPEITPEQRTAITEGGIIGLVLLINHWLGVPASVASPLLDAASYALAFKFLGWDFLLSAGLASVSLAGFYRIWECLPPMLPDLTPWPLAAALLGGVFVGVGVGLIVRQGGSSGGDDALALVIHKLTGWRLSRAYLFTDLTVLFASLSYIPFRRIAFSLVTVTVSSLLIDFIKGNTA